MLYKSLLGFERYWYWGTGYWPILAGIGWIGYWAIFYSLWNPIPITITEIRSRRPPLSLSKSQSNSSRRRAAATIGLQRSRFANKQQWQGVWGGVGAPVERSPFMRDWQD